MLLAELLVVLLAVLLVELLVVEQLILIFFQVNFPVVEDLIVELKNYIQVLLFRIIEKLSQVFGDAFR